MSSSFLEIDSLSYSNSLQEEGGIDKKAADAQARLMMGIIKSHLVTKTDLYNTEQSILNSIKSIENKIELSSRDTKIWTGSMIAGAITIISVVIGIFSYLK